jgi:hypothetical protein
MKIAKSKQQKKTAFLFRFFLITVWISLILFLNFPDS